MNGKHLEAPAIYSIPSSINVLKTSVDFEYLDEMIKFSEKYRSENFENDNLIGRTRTDWNLHKRDGFKEAFKPMLEKIYSNILLYANSDIIYGHSVPFLPEGTKVSGKIFNCWTAWFEDGGATLPHSHGNLPDSFSTAFYLKLPEGKTSLGFGNFNEHKKIIYDIREGDLLIFPSSLSHWGFNHDKGRIVTSTNWVLDIDYSLI